MKNFLIISLLCLFCHNPAATQKPLSVNKRLEVLEGTVKSNTLTINNLQDSINELNKRLEGYEKFKSESKGFDTAVGDYGTSLIAIVLAITLLFGFVYFIAARWGASSSFREFFDSYERQIRGYTQNLSFVKDKYESQFNISKDIDEDKETFEENIANQYHDTGSPK